MRHQNFGLQIYDERRATPGYTLFSPLQGKVTNLIGVRGDIVHQWSHPLTVGTYAYLLENGNLLWSGRLREGPKHMGGLGGLLREYDWNGNVVWEYRHVGQHHDFRRRSNGNTIYLGWEPLPEAAAATLQQGLVERIRAGLVPPVHEDSPLFRFFPKLKGMDMSHEITDVFRERVAYAQAFKDKLADAREVKPREAALARLNAIRHDLGNLQVVDQGVLVDLLLSYRDVRAFQELIELYEAMPGGVQDAAVVRQQYALALNRIGERRKAIRVLEPILKNGGDAETYGILGRVYKDYYKAAQAQGRSEARAHLEKAIEAYTRGFEVELTDYYPGINAILLLADLGTDEAMHQMDRLVPRVPLAVPRRGGANSIDYWDLATVLTLALLGHDPVTADAMLPRVLAAAEASWMVETTADDLERIAAAWEGKRDTAKLTAVTAALREKEAHLKGLPAAAV